MHITKAGCFDSLQHFHNSFQVKSTSSTIQFLFKRGNHMYLTFSYPDTRSMEALG